jgi:transcriptional regulator with XRE-family HTH domain
MVIELRTSLGDTQEEFAARLRTALSTVARYETSRPPAGAMLLRLAAVAEQNAIGHKADDAKAKALINLATTFKALYFDEVARDLGVKDTNKAFQIRMTFPDGSTISLTKEKR